MQASILQHKVSTSREKALKVDSKDHDVYTAYKYRKSRKTDNSVLQKEICFFRGKPAQTSGLHEAWLMSE